MCPDSPATTGAGRDMAAQGSWPAVRSRLITVKREAQRAWSSKVDVETGWLTNTEVPKASCEAMSLPAEYKTNTASPLE